MRKLGALPSGWLGSIASEDAEDDRPFLLDGVRVKFDPISRKAVRAARAACATALRLHEDDFEEASDALSREMIRYGIVAWEGVGDRDGSIAQVTPEMVDLFIAEPDYCEAAEVVYVRPWLLRDTEKNVSAGSSLGTSVVAMPVDDIVKTSAAGTKKAGARPIRTAKPKKSAPAAHTSPATRKAKPVKASSKS